MYLERNTKRHNPILKWWNEKLKNGKERCAYQQGEKSFFLFYHFYFVLCVLFFAEFLSLNFPFFAVAFSIHKNLVAKTISLERSDAIHRTMNMMMKRYLKKKYFYIFFVFGECGKLRFSEFFINFWNENFVWNNLSIKIWIFKNVSIIFTTFLRSRNFTILSCWKVLSAFIFGTIQSHSSSFQFLADNSNSLEKSRY